MAKRKETYRDARTGKIVPSKEVERIFKLAEEILQESKNAKK